MARSLVDMIDRALMDNKGRAVRGQGNGTEPTYANQLRFARELLKTRGAAALNNPHAMIGRTCGCGDCFCCAAADVYAAATLDQPTGETIP